MSLNHALNSVVLNGSGGTQGPWVWTIDPTGGIQSGGEAWSYVPQPAYEWVPDGGFIASGSADSIRVRTIAAYTPGQYGLSSSGAASVCVTKDYTPVTSDASIDYFRNIVPTTSMVPYAPQYTLSMITDDNLSTAYYSYSIPGYYEFVLPSPINLEYITFWNNSNRGSMELHGLIDDTWVLLGTWSSASNDNIAKYIYSSLNHYIRVFRVWVLTPTAQWHGMQTISAHSTKARFFTSQTITTMTPRKYEGGGGLVAAGAAQTCKANDLVVFEPTGGIQSGGDGICFVPLPLADYYPDGGIVAGGAGEQCMIKAYYPVPYQYSSTDLIPLAVSSSTTGVTSGAVANLSDGNQWSYVWGAYPSGISVTYDFGPTTTVHAARVYVQPYISSGSSSVYSYMGLYSVEASYDGTSWTTLYDGIMPIGSGQWSYFDRTSFFIRYLRITTKGPGGYRWTYGTDQYWDSNNAISEVRLNDTLNIGNLSSAGSARTRYYVAGLVGWYDDLITGGIQSGDAVTEYKGKGFCTYRPSGGLVSSGTAVTGMTIRSYTSSGGGLVASGSPWYAKCRDVGVYEGTGVISVRIYTHVVRGVRGVYSPPAWHGPRTGGAASVVRAKAYSPEAYPYGYAGAANCIWVPVTKFVTESAGGVRCRGSAEVSFKQVLWAYSPTGGFSIVGEGECWGHGGLKLSGVNGGPGYGGGGVLRNGAP